MVRMTWIGHGTFQIEADGHTVLVDPFIGSNPTTETKTTDFSPETILVTHAHSDHIADAVELAKHSGATIYAIAELAGYLKKQGVENVVGFNMGGTVTFPGGTAKMVPAWHSSMTDDGEASSIPSGFVVRFGGKTIYFAGDTALFGDMALIGEEGLDVAVLPIGDHFTMGPADAIKALRLLNAPVVVPGHYSTFPMIEQDADAFARAVAEQTASQVEVFTPGESRDL